MNMLWQVFGISGFFTIEMLLWISTDLTCTYNYDASSKIVF